MECIRCGDGDAFNRVVVNQVSKHELGLFCGPCEDHLFGRLLSEPAWHQEHGCAFCDRDGPYALPPLECLVEDDGSPRLLEYGSLNGAVHICERHLDVVATTESPPAERRELEDRRRRALEA